MKILKYLFLLLLILVIAAVVYVATLSSTYQIEESAILGAPPELVFNTVNDYTTWQRWGPWKEQSKDMEVQYFEKTVGEGAGNSWVSSDQGNGTMTTTAIVPNSSITQEMQIETPFGESQSDVYWKFEPEETGTKVTWGMKGTFSFMEKAYWATQSMKMDAMIRPMYQKGLANLEKEAQQQMAVYSINVDGVTEHGGGFYMYMTAAARLEAVGKKKNQMLPVVRAYMKNNTIPINGVPFVIYNQSDAGQGTTIFSAAIPTRDKVIPASDSEVFCGFMKNQKVLKITLKGHTKNLENARMKGAAYIKEQGLTKSITGTPFEIFSIGLETSSNPANWITEVYLPID